MGIVVTIFVLLGLSGCLKPDIEGPKPKVVFKKPPPGQTFPPIEPEPEPGFVTLNRLEDTILLNVQSIESQTDRENARYLVSCNTSNQGLPTDLIKQGVDLAMNRLSNERFTYQATPIGQSGCVYKIDLDNYSLTKRDWQILEQNSLLNFVSETSRNENIQFLTQTLKPYMFTQDMLCTAFECDENADKQGRLYGALTNQAVDTTAFLAQEGINLQAEVNDQDVLFAGFSGSVIALQKTRMLQVVESDNGYCLGTFDAKIGGDDLFNNPFSQELAVAGGVLNSNRVFRHDAQEWICSLPNGLFGKWRLNNAADVIDSSAPTDIVIDPNNAAVDGSIRLGRCSACHHADVAIPFKDQIADFVRNNPAFNQNEKRLGEIFFNETRIAAIIDDINKRHRQEMELLGITAEKDPLTNDIYRTFRSEMDANQVAGYTMLPTEEFLERLRGASVSSQVFGNLLGGGTISLSVLSGNFETLVDELNLFEDREI